VSSGEDAFIALAERSDAIVFVTDHAMRMVYANAALERDTGFTAEDFAFTQRDNPFIHREDADRVATALARFADGTQTISDPIDCRFIDRWGRMHRRRSIVTKIDFRGAPALLFMCTAIEAPDPVRTDDRQYRALVETAEDAIVRIDNAGRFLFANPRAYSLLGWSAVELGHLRLDDVIAPRDRAILPRELSRSLGARDPVRFEIVLVHKDGHPITCRVSLTALTRFGHPGELFAIVRPLHEASAGDVPITTAARRDHAPGA
jgi:PAS domain S-box-containing protein